MAKNVDKIEIKEPPIQELQKKRSCLWRGCTTGCGCIIVFLVASIIIIKLATTPRVKQLDQIPAHVAERVPLYDTENIERIAFTSGKDRGRAIERAALLPKIILAPVLATLEKNLRPAETNTSSTEPSIDWAAIRKAIEKPTADHRDVIQIEWTDLPAKPGFITEWYRRELEKKHFALIDTDQTQVRFHKDDIDGVVFVKDATEQEGTDYVLVTINIPSAE